MSYLVFFPAENEFGGGKQCKFLFNADPLALTDVGSVEELFCLGVWKDSARKVSVIRGSCLRRTLCGVVKT